MEAIISTRTSRARAKRNIETFEDYKGANYNQQVKHQTILTASKRAQHSSHSYLEVVTDYEDQHVAERALENNSTLFPPQEKEISLRRKKATWNPVIGLRNPYRVHTLNGKKVILEADLAFALGTFAGHLNNIAVRKADWFPKQVRFTISAEQASTIGLWWTKAEIDFETGKAEILQKEYAPVLPAVYTLDGVIAMTHWLAAYAAEPTDAQPVVIDLLDRFKKVRKALLDKI
ncbi:MAG: hypothetical protein ACI959_000429 [Limisphaerales bacterium]|jgi:hypothetical protein